MDISTLPNAEFHPISGLFPNIVNNEIAAQQRAVDARNVQGQADFDFLVKEWLSAATLVRNADAAATLPAKPISPKSWTLALQDGNVNSQAGKWMVQVQDGPGYGTCPDLPKPVKTSPSNATGLVVAGTPVQPTIDQKLDSIAVSLLDIQKMLKQAMGGQ